jgi:hypothetical protein
LIAERAAPLIADRAAPLIAERAAPLIADREKPLADSGDNRYGRRYTRKEVVRKFEYLLDM